MNRKPTKFTKKLTPIFVTAEMHLRLQKETLRQNRFQTEVIRDAIDEYLQNREAAFGTKEIPKVP